MAGPKFKDAEDKKYYTDSLQSFFRILNLNGIAPDKYLKITDDNYDEASDYFQTLLNNKSIMFAGMDKIEVTTPLEFFDKLYDMMPYKDEQLTGQQVHNNANFWLFLYDENHFEYKAVNYARDNLISSRDIIKNANVWRSMSAIRETIHNLDVELEGTKRPWSSDSDDFKAVKKNLSELSKKLQEMSPCTTDEKGNLIFRDYSFDNISKDFETLMSSIGDYQDSHKAGALGARQEERLKIMGRISTAYENVRIASVKAISKETGKPIELTSKEFKEDDIIDNICLTRLKLHAPALYNKALKNRPFFNELRSRMKNNELFQRDKKELGLEGIAKLTEKQLKGKNYFFYNEEAVRKGDDTFESRMLRDFNMTFGKFNEEIANNPERNSFARFDYSRDDIMFLQRYAAARGIASLKNPIEYSDLDKYYLAFKDEVKSGSLIVFDKKGKLTKPSDALKAIVDRINHPDGRPIFFKNTNSTYIAQDIVLDPVKSSNSSLKIFKFVGDTNKTINKDDFMISDMVVQEVSDLRKDLYEARSFWHSKEHNAMSDALNKLCDKIDQIDFSKCEPKQLKDAFAELAGAAAKYAESHTTDAYNHRLNDNQVKRLVVAQKIMSINESISNPDITLKEYLINRYSNKKNLDIMRIADAEWKKAKANPVNQNKDPKGYIKQKRLEEADRFCKIDLTSTGKKYYVRDPMNLRNDKSFRNIVMDKSYFEMKNLLKETPEKTAGDFKSEDIGAVNSLVKTEVNAMLKGKSEEERIKLIRDIGEEKLFDDEYDFESKATQKDTNNEIVPV